MTRTATNSLILIAILLVIIGLNILFYTDRSGERESEQNGSRSTYSARPYGTRGFYLLLRDLGYQVTQFEEPLDRLKNHADIKGLFIIGPPLPFTTEELAALEDWVKAGGYLVIVDREIYWSIAGGAIHMISYSRYKEWRLPHVVQPTPFTAGVDKVQLTEFAQGVKAENAPVTSHVGDEQASVLIDFRYGQGRIVLLGEPYIVANNGIEVADNLILSRNIVRDMPAGVIAFDEYHHGHEATSLTRTGTVGVFLNLYDYYKHTPVVGVLAQFGLIVGAWLYSRGRWFTRPVPLLEEKRRRSLEYVSSMANLAHRQRLRPLVVENVYRSLKRRLTSGGSSDATRTIPPRLASRYGLDAGEINELLSQGEPASDGKTINDHELLDWVKRIRELEARLRRMK